MSIMASALAIILLLATPTARGVDRAHVHGLAEMEMVVTGGTIRVLLRTPMDSLLGFEHLPKNAAQRAALATLRTDLADPLRFFRPPPEAGCRARHHEASSSLFSGKVSGEHSDLEYRFSLECRDPSQLLSLDVPMFDHFRRLREIRVQLVTDQGQRAVVLVRKNRQIRLR